MIKTVKKYLVPHTDNDYKPHLLRERSMGVLFGIALVLFCTSLGSSYILTRTDFGATVLPAVLVDLTNEHRIENSEKPLSVNPTLQVAALMKAKDMAANQYFAHTSPTGVTPWQWFTKAGYRFTYAGENLAINFTESSDVEKAWIASPAHHANLISDKFTETGIATYDGMYQGRPTTFVVQLFGTQPFSATKSVTKTTSVPTTPSSEKVAVATPEVKGASIAVAQEASTEPAPVLIVNEPTFSVAKNVAEVDEGGQEETIVPSRYATLSQRFLAHQARYVQTIYFVLILLVYIALIGMVVFEFRRVHVKNILLGMILLCGLAILAYINSGFILSFL